MAYAKTVGIQNVDLDKVNVAVLVKLLREFATMESAQGSHYTAADLLAAAELLENGRPIPVSERLPKNEVGVLAYVHDGNLANWITACWDEHKQQWFVDVHDSDCWRDPEYITHWLPLPPRPEQP